MTEPAGARLVVQKFGGTSVATRDGRSSVVGHVASARAGGERVVVVVSAMGRSGDPYATDTLLGLLSGREVDPREADLLASCGEVLSAVVLAHELRAAGVPARAMTGAAAGIVTDDDHGSARIVGVDPVPVRSAVDAGFVPVVAGFQGTTAEGEVTTLGRGGSDTTACALAAALHADSVEIYTDVDGVMTADPRTCDGARVLGALQYEELFQMAKAGSKVVHAPAAETAMRAGVPLRVRNTYSTAPGTLVTEGVAGSEAGRVATAVSHSQGIARVVLEMSADGDPGARMRALTRVFRVMADASISLDMFTPCGGSLVFSMPEGSLAEAMRVLDRLELPYTVETGLAKVTLVGAGMHGVPGVMARVAECLAAAGVDILQVADSHYTISVLVRLEVERAAIEALHDGFALAE